MTVMLYFYPELELSFHDRILVVIQARPYLVHVHLDIDLSLIVKEIALTTENY